MAYYLRCGYTAGITLALRAGIWAWSLGGVTSMRYFLAIVLPPIAVLSCGKPFQALLNIILTLAGWIPGALHALFVVHSHHADLRARFLERAYYAAASAGMQRRFE